MTSTLEAGSNPLEQTWCAVDLVDGCAVVSFSGDLDIDHYAELDDGLVFAGQLSDRVVVDLTEVASMAPTVFGMLVGQLHRLRDDDARTICLVGPDDSVRRALDAVLDTTELDRVCVVHHTIDGAVAALQ
jgi:anti-anti-sigma factor